MVGRGGQHGSELSTRVSSELFSARLPVPSLAVGGPARHPTTKSAPRSAWLKQHNSKRCARCQAWSGTLISINFVPYHDSKERPLPENPFYRCGHGGIGIQKGPQSNTEVCFTLQPACLVSRTDLPSFMVLRNDKDFTSEPP